MSVKGLKIEYGNSVFALPREALTAVLAKAGGFELKVLLILASSDILRADVDVACEAVCRELDCTKSAFNKAVKFWVEAGVISHAQSVPKAPSTKEPPKKALMQSDMPTYTEAQAADIIEKNSELSGIIDACQQITGKIFTPADAQAVVTMYDYLGLVDAGYIETLFAYCKSLGKTSARYAEKVAVSMADEGIDTTDALNEYIARRERLETDMQKLRTLIGANGRALTAKEKKLFECWLDEWRFDTEVITRAYEVTVDNLGELKLTYMNKVLENWHRDGLNTIEAVTASLEAYAKNKAAATKNGSGFETDEMFEAALRRSQSYVEKIGKKG